jgi:hypothetical protein
MDPEARRILVESLTEAFDQALDMTPTATEPAHIVLPKVALPPPWSPRTTRALTIWENWPTSRPLFFIDERVVGETGAPPRSNHSRYALGESWRGFSYTFPWSGDDPVRVVQLWLGRFTVEPT